jgi:hypothetical protein
MLPKIDLPTFTIKVPSTGKESTFRPFVVKEEKLLMMASESNDSNEIIKTTKQVINNCLVSGDINVEKLAFFDVDYLFVALRSKSIGETVELKYRCNHKTDGVECRNVFDVNLNITDYEVYGTDKEKLDIDLQNGIKLKMKYPTYTAMKSVNSSDNPFDRKIDLLVNCIEIIYDKDKVLTDKDFSKEELRGFIENLSEQQFRKLDEFINDLPFFQFVAEADCNKCGFHHKIKIQDFESFFQ